MSFNIIFKNYNFLKKSLSLINKKNIIYLYLLLFIGLISSFFEILSFLILTPLLTLLIRNKSIDDFSFFSFVSLDTKQFFTNNLTFSVLAILIIVSLIKLALNYFYNWEQSKFISLINNDISTKLFKNYIKKDYKYYLDTNSSNIIASLTNEIERVIQIFNSISVFFIESLIILGTFFSLIYVNFSITLILSFFILFTLLSFNYWQRKISENFSKKSYELVNLKYNLINQTFRNIKDVKVYCFENVLFKEYKNIIESENNIKRKILFLLNMPRSYLELVVTCSITILFIYIYFTDNFNNLIPLVSIYILALFRILPSINKILNSLQYLKNHSTSINFILNELLVNNTVQDDENKNQLNFNKHILVNDISFSYNQSQNYILKNINISIKKGQKIGIIGKSGSGKTTLIDILLCLLKPDKGSIIVDGVNVEFHKRCWRDKIGYVQQSIFLFNASIKENIAFGIPINEINEKKIYHLIQILNLSSILENKPHGIDSMIGENGNNLSGGQRQRLAIARALYKEPEILILDEVTSSLDEETELSVIQSIYSYNPLMTLLIISHKTVILDECDIIYKIKNGNLSIS